MTVFPARPGFFAVPAAPLHAPAKPPARPEAQAEPLIAARPSAAEWARRRREEREARRLEAMGGRVVGRLSHLGPSWHLVDWPRTDQAGLAQPGGGERMGFLAVGPGGVYAITVVEYGRSRVLIAGDVVQIGGRRPPHITEARRDARTAGKAISAVVGHSVPVIGVLTLVGSGVVTVYGLPKEVVVTTHRELEHLLLSGGSRISPATAEKLSDIARDPATWFDATYRSGADYRWYADGRTGTDKPATRR